MQCANHKEAIVCIIPSVEILAHIARLVLQRVYPVPTLPANTSVTAAHCNVAFGSFNGLMDIACRPTFSSGVFFATAPAFRLAQPWIEFAAVMVIDACGQAPYTQAPYIAADLCNCKPRPPVRTLHFCLQPGRIQCMFPPTLMTRSGCLLCMSLLASWACLFWSATAPGVALKTSHVGDAAVVL